QYKVEHSGGRLPVFGGKSNISNAYDADVVFRKDSRRVAPGWRLRGISFKDPCRAITIWLFSTRSIMFWATVTFRLTTWFRPCNRPAQVHVVLTGHSPEGIVSIADCRHGNEDIKHPPDQKGIDF